MYKDTTNNEVLTDWDINTLFAGWLAIVYGPVKIAGGMYDTAQALKLVDPIAYRCAKLNYIDSLLEDGTIIECDANEIKHDGAAQ